MILFDNEMCTILSMVYGLFKPLFYYVTGTCFKETAIFYLFGFTLFTVDLELLIYTKNSWYSLTVIT